MIQTHTQYNLAKFLPINQFSGEVLFYRILVNGYLARNVLSSPSIKIAKFEGTVS